MKHPVSLLNLGQRDDDRRIAVLDPMCGVGTLLCAFHVAAEKHLRKRNTRCEFYGADKCQESIDLAKDNLKSLKCENFRVIRNEHENLMSDFAESSFDLVLVDPPWGHRHSKFNEVKANMLQWARTWMRLLKADSGLLLVITIQTRWFERQIFPVLQNQMNAELVLRKNFDNMGFTQCKIYGLIKKKS